jgi:hypothetical protein
MRITIGFADSISPIRVLIWSEKPTGLKLAYYSVFDMILQLADNGSSRARTKMVYNPTTGMAIAVPLASKGRGKARRAVRKSNKLKRVVQRQEAKTKRQATRQVKRQTGRDVRVQKKVKKMIRVKGDQAIIQQRKANKLTNILNKASQSPVYEPEQIDSIPRPSVPGGDYMMTPEDFEPQQDLDWNNEYDEFELMPQEEYEDDLPSDGMFYPGEEEEEEPSGELSAPFIPAFISGIKNAIQKASNFGIDTAKELMRLRMQNNQLLYQLRQQKTNTYLAGGAGLVGGTILGAVISRKLKRR